MPEARKDHEGSLADKLLQDVRDSHRSISIYLVNGFQLKGEIVDFDQETILINHKNLHQLVMRSGVASMYPLPGSKAGAEEWWRDHVSPSVEE